jgi:hypothetical protein
MKVRVLKNTNSISHERAIQEILDTAEAVHTINHASSSIYHKQNHCTPVTTVLTTVITFTPKKEE